MKLKKGLSVVLVLVIFISMVGCGSNNEAVETSAEKTSLVLAITMDDSGQDREITQFFKKRVEELSDGNIEVDLFLGGQLGSEKEILEQMKMGEIDLNYGILAPELYFPEYNAMSIPYLFPSFDSIKDYLDGEINEKITELSKQNGGVVPIGIHSSGARWTTSNKSFNDASSIRGVKLRLPEIKWWIAVWSDMGALPTPIAATEIVSSLQTGVVDAQENTLTNIVGRQMWEYQDYLIKTEHVHWWQMWLMSEKTEEKLGEDQLAIVKQALKETTERNDSMVVEMNEEFVEKCIEEGMELIEPDKEDLVSAALPQIEKILSDELDELAYKKAIEIIEGN